MPKMGVLMKIIHLKPIVTLLIGLNLLISNCSAVLVRVGFFNGDVFLEFTEPANLNLGAIQNGKNLRDALELYLDNEIALNIMAAARDANLLGVNAESLEFAEIWKEFEPGNMEKFGIIVFEDTVPLEEDKINALGSGNALINLNVTQADIDEEFEIDADENDDVGM